MVGIICAACVIQVPGESEESLLERYSQAELMTAKRIAWILQESCEIGSIPGVEEITRLAGKLIVTFHGHNKLLGDRLLHTLAHFSSRSSGKIALQDLDMEVITTISEVMQALIVRFVKQNIVDREFIREILRVYEGRLAEIFRREKNIDMTPFVQPLLKVERMLKTAKYHSFADRDDLLHDCRRLIVQYSQGEI
jgi:hypothetical protein